MTVKFFTSNSDLEITLTDTVDTYVQQASPSRESNTYEILFADVQGDYSYEVTGTGGGNDKISGGLVIEN